MDTHEMKIQALRNGLKDESKPHGSIRVTSLNDCWRLECSCYRLTDFSFYLYGRRDNGDWHPHKNMTEDEAEAFLRGAGLLDR